jgi:hypothetical protein
MGFRERLVAMQGKAKEQMADYHPGGSYAALPDDQYQFRVKATIEETQKLPKRMQVTWCFVVNEGECEGRQVWDQTIIEDNKVGLGICRDRIEALGYEWPEEDFGMLEDVINDITDRAPRINATTKTKENDGGYLNTRLNKWEVLDPFAGSENEQDSGNEQDSAAEQDSESEQEPEKVEPPKTKGEAFGKKKEPEPEPAISPELAGLLDFCASQGIDGVTAEMSIGDIIEGLKAGECKFKEEEISAEELELLVSCDGEELIERKPSPAKKKGLVSKKK